MSHRGIVIIPAWKRAEFLGACIHHIRNADGAGDYLYFFALDRKADNENLEVIKEFTLDHEVRQMNNHSYHGNTANLLNAYQWAYNKSQGKGLIFLIEEDIFIGKNFFNWHEYVQKNADVFFASGCKNQNEEMPDLGEDDFYFSNKYQSLGVSFKPENLTEILKHNTHEYLRGMPRYLRREFPNSALAETHCEQDGLINRIMERDFLIGAYPVVPVAYHAGFYGYNRLGRKDDLKRLNLQDRINKILEMSDEEMNERAVRFKDIKRCDLNGSQEFYKELSK